MDVRTGTHPMAELHKRQPAETGDLKYKSNSRFCQLNQQTCLNH